MYLTVNTCCCCASAWVPSPPLRQGRPRSLLAWCQTAAVHERSTFPGTVHRVQQAGLRTFTSVFCILTSRLLLFCLLHGLTMFGPSSLPSHRYVDWGGVHRWVRSLESQCFSAGLCCRSPASRVACWTVKSVCCSKPERSPSRCSYSALDGNIIPI